MYTVDYNLQGARVTKTNYIMEWWLVSLFCIYENHYELELSGASFSYDMSCWALLQYFLLELYNCIIDFVTYFNPDYFINPFEVVFGCFLCLKVGIVVAISNWK